MENKQLESEDLLMNKKEELIWKVIDNVISCCAITRIDGAKSITREDVVGKFREENVVLTRCLVVEQMVHAGFTISTIAFILNRTVQATRHLLKMSNSVPDGLHLCLYVKDVIDDVDGYDGIAFNRWYADMCRKGIQVDWYNCR